MQQFKQQNMGSEAEPPGRNADAWQDLVVSFALQKPGVNPWDANLLDQQYRGASHGEKCTIQFLLNVWNAEQAWMCGKFDVIEALSVWEGSPSHAAFLDWAKAPWWP